MNKLEPSEGRGWKIPITTRGSLSTHECGKLWSATIKTKQKPRKTKPERSKARRESDAHPSSPQRPKVCSNILRSENVYWLYAPWLSCMRVSGARRGREGGGSVHKRKTNEKVKVKEWSARLTPGQVWHTEAEGDNEEDDVGDNVTRLRMSTLQSSMQRGQGGRSLGQSLSLNAIEVIFVSPTRFC